MVALPGDSGTVGEGKQRTTGKGAGCLRKFGGGKCGAGKELAICGDLANYGDFHNNMPCLKRDFVLPET
jgi:hypothetical protein